MFKKKKPKAFLLTGIVQRVVVDAVDMKIYAQDEVSARAKAMEVLESFPQPVTATGVPFCFIRERTYGWPDILELRETEDEGAA